LRARVRPFVLRRLKRATSQPELPPRTVVVCLHVELAPDERAVYDAIRAASARRRRLRASPQAGARSRCSKALLRLRQPPATRPRATAPNRPWVSLAPARCAPAPPARTLEARGPAREPRGGRSPRDTRRSSFSQWTSLLDRVESGGCAVRSCRSRVSTDHARPRRVVEHFQSDSGPPVLLVSLRAGGHRAQSHRGRQA
jgi:hypothetical protein